MTARSTKTLSSFLNQVWGTTRDIFEPTDLSKHFSRAKKLLIAFLALYQGVAYNCEVWAEMERHKTILLASENFLGENFSAQDKRSQMLVKTLYFLPQLHYQSLRQVERHQNPQHKRRGMANANTVVLSDRVEDDSEFLSVFIHELGHVVDLGMLSAGTGSKTEFKNTSSHDPSVGFYHVAWHSDVQKKLENSVKNFISGYAKSDPFEDFSESYNFYLLHGDEFRKRAKTSPSLKQRYDFLKKKVFFGKEYSFSAELFLYPPYFFDVTTLAYDFPKFMAAIGIETQESEDERVRRQQRATRRSRPVRGSMTSRLRRNNLSRRLRNLLGMG